MKHFDFEGFPFVITKWQHDNVYAYWNMQYNFWWEIIEREMKEEHSIARHGHQEPIKTPIDICRNIGFQCWLICKAANTRSSYIHSIQCSRIKTQLKQAQTFIKPLKLS